MTVQDFLKELGGAAVIARSTGIPLSTIASWGHENSIPHWRRPALAELAQDKGLTIPDEFAPKAAA